MLRDGLERDLVLVARARLLSRRRRHLQVLRAASKIGIWEMVCPSARVHSASFTRHPVSRDFSSTCVLSNIISTQQAGIEFRHGIIQNLDNGIAKLGPPHPSPSREGSEPSRAPILEYHYFSLEYHYFCLT